MSLIFLPPQTRYFHRFPLPISLSVMLTHDQRQSKSTGKNSARLTFRGRKKSFTDILLLVKSDKQHIHHNANELTSHATNTRMCLYINQKEYRHNLRASFVCANCVTKPCACLGFKHYTEISNILTRAPSFFFFFVLSLTNSIAEFYTQSEAPVWRKNIDYTIVKSEQHQAIFLPFPKKPIRGYKFKFGAQFATRQLNTVQ